MVKVVYWQWGKRVEHPEEFDDLEDAVAFLREGGVPQYAGQVRDFAPDAIIDGDHIIDGRELNRLLD